MPERALSDHIHATAYPPAEKTEITKICSTLSEKFYSDEELDKFSADWFQSTDSSDLLRQLSIQFADVTRKENYNRHAQANITRVVLRLWRKIYPSSLSGASEKGEKPRSFLWKTGHLIGRILRYPLYIFTRLFGSLQLAVSTFTSLDRSFWRPLFPNATVSLLITLPIDFIFICISVLQFQWFEGSLFAKSLGVNQKKDVASAMEADQTTIKVVSLLVDEVMQQKKHFPAEDFPDHDIRSLFHRLMSQFSSHVVDKRQYYQEYKEPWQQKAIRWGFNIIGGFLVCCLNAFTFKYTIAAFATSRAVVTLLPGLAALLANPAIILGLTCAAVIYGLVYYSSKRSNSPDHNGLKFIKIRKKTETFQRVWTGYSLLLKKNEEILNLKKQVEDPQKQAVLYRESIQNRMLRSKKWCTTHAKLNAEIRRHAMHAEIRKSSPQNRLSPIPKKADLQTPPMNFFPPEVPVSSPRQTVQAGNTSLFSPPMSFSDEPQSPQSPYALRQFKERQNRTSPSKGQYLPISAL